MSQVKHQHYVPRFLLKNFTDERGKLSVFGRGKGAWFRAKPEDVAFQKYYYAERTDGGETDTQSIEKELSRIEGAGSAVVREMLSGAKLTTDQRADFALFLTTQDFRSPRRRQEFADMLFGNEHHKFDKSTVSSVENYVRTISQASKVKKPFDASMLSETSKLKIEEDGTVIVPFETTVRALKAAGHFAPAVANMDWRLLRTRSSNRFIICDSPVQLYEHPSTLEKYAGPAYLRKDSYVAMPLTSEVCFVAHHPSPADTNSWRSRFAVEDAKGTDVRFLNHLQLSGCFNQVYATINYRWLDQKSAALLAVQSRLSFLPVGDDGRSASVSTKR